MEPRATIPASERLALMKRAIEKARSLHCTESDDVQVDDHAKVTTVDEGVWVQAVVFVPNAELEEPGLLGGLRSA